MAAAVHVSVALPEPLEVLTVSHAESEAAVHAHPALLVVSAKVDDEPVDAALAVDGAIPYVQLAAACVTVNVLPWTVMTPTRCAAAAFAVADQVSVALPEPLGGVTVSHAEESEETVHAQPEPLDVKAKVDEEAAAAALAAPGAIA